jgi:hypothetical protein
MAKALPSAQTYLMLSMAILSFSMSYLYPQFKQKDERMKMIRQKAMFYSYFAMMGYLIIFLLIAQVSEDLLSGSDILNALIALNISTLFLTMVILAKRN